MQDSQLYLTIQNKVVNWDGLDYCILLGENLDKGLEGGQSNFDRVYTGVICEYADYNGENYFQQDQSMCKNYKDTDDAQIRQNDPLKYRRKLYMSRNIILVKGYNPNNCYDKIEQIVAIELDKLDDQTPEKLYKSLLKTRVFPVANYRAVDNIDKLKSYKDLYKNMFNVPTVDDKGHIVYNSEVTDKSSAFVVELVNVDRYKDITKSTCISLIVDQVRGTIKERLVDTIHKREIDRNKTVYIEASNKFLRVHSNKVAEYIPQSLSNYFDIQKQSFELQRMNRKLELQGAEASIPGFVFIVDQYIATIEPQILTWINRAICNYSVNNYKTFDIMNNSLRHGHRSPGLTINIKVVQKNFRVMELSKLIGVYQYVIHECWYIRAYSLRVIDTDEIPKKFCTWQIEDRDTLRYTNRTSKSKYAIPEVTKEDTIQSFENTNMHWWTSKILQSEISEMVSVVPPGGIILTGIKKIGKQAFMQSKSIQHLYDFNDVETIQQQALFNCYNLRELPIQDSLKKIGHNAFDGVSVHEETLKFGQNVSFIGSEAFKQCNINNLIIENPNIHLTQTAFSGAKIKRLVIQRNKQTDTALNYCDCKVTYK